MYILFWHLIFFPLSYNRIETPSHPSTRLPSRVSVLYVFNNRYKTNNSSSTQVPTINTYN